jgi:hypothetical protein
VTDLPTSPRRKPSRRRLATRAGLITLAIVIGGAVILAGGAWLLRRDVAREAATGWLEDRGIESEIEIERLELDRLVGRLRVGPATNPDLVIERIEVDYALTGPWAGAGLGARPSRVRLVGPVLQARWKEGELDFGALEPLIEEFSRRPPRPDERGPRVLVERGALDLSTPYGRLRAVGGAVVDDGELLTLDARVPAARLAGESFDLALSDTTFSVRKTGDRLGVSARGGVTRLDVAGLEAAGATATLTAELPYPDLKARRGGGRVVTDLTVRADRLLAGAVDAREADLSVGFEGAGRGWPGDLALTGAASVRGRAAGLTASGVDLRAAVFDGRAETLNLAAGEAGVAWRAAGDARLTAATARQGGLAVAAPRLRMTQADFASGSGGAASGTFRLAVAAERATQDRLVLGDLAADFLGAALFGGEPSGVQLRGSLRAGRGGWSALGRPTANDVPELAAMKRAFGDFALSAPAIEIGLGDRMLVALDRPLVLSPRSGGAIIVSERGETPLFDAGAGAFDLALRGGGLPDAAVQVTRYRAGAGRGGFRFEADTTLSAVLDFAPAENVTFGGSGALAIGRGGTTFAPRGCVSAAVEKLEFGQNDVEALSVSLCPSTGPLLTIADGGWTVRGRAREGRATAPFLGMRVAEAEGVLTVRGGARPPSLDFRIDGARVADTSEAIRFHPLIAAGQASLENEVWRAELGMRPPERAETVATVALRHDGRTGVGGTDLRADALTFAEGGLQPAMLTPLAGLLGEPVTGAIDFAGRFDWTAEGGTSGGRLTVRGLDFVSPLGPLKNLQGTVALTSLAPLISAPAQRLTAASVQSFAALDTADLRFQLVDQVVKVEGGTIGANGGVVTLEPFDIALEPGKTWDGAVRLSGVGLAPIVEASAFRDRVDLEARVSGRLPFVVTPDGVRFVDGRLAADAPGRLSIDRAALTGIEADGGGEAAEVVAQAGGGVQDLAYQALEHLSFDLMDAQVNSLPGGRLGVLFRIKGRHDPPNPEELRLTWTDLIRRRFLDPERRLPLPAGTEVDLTLDATLNLDQLLADWKSVNEVRSGRSEPVQPRP